MIPVLSQSHYMFLDEPLVEAARAGDYSKVKALLLLGANVNCEADDGRGTALIAAIAEQHSDVVRLLVAQGADVNREANYGFYGVGERTPLQTAIGQPDIMALLRLAGAKN